MAETTTIQRLTAYLPIVMSLVSLAIVIQGHMEFGSHPPADEGWQAHVFQFLMGAQVPIILLFAVNSRFAFRKHLPVLVAQIALWVLALGALRYFAL